MRRAFILLPAFILGLWLATAAVCVAQTTAPEERLADPALEARAERLSRELRCVVCQNQTIDDSDAPLAADLRRALRERLAAGDTDAEAMGYLVDRYGDYVLLKPPFRPLTLALWLGPLAIMLTGAGAVVLYWRRRSGGDAASDAATGTTEKLSAAERRRLNALLRQEDER